MIVLLVLPPGRGVIAYNATGFREPGSGPTTTTRLRLRSGPLAVGQIVYLGVVAAAMVTLTRGRLGNCAAHRVRRLRYPIAVGVVGARRRVRVGVCRRASYALSKRAVATGTTAHHPARHRFAASRPAAALRRHRRDASNLDRFLAKADIVRDTTTPVARTFPSWTAILTGRSPSVTGARFNLVAARDGQGKSDPGRRSAQGRLSHHLLDRRGALRKHRRELWLRSGRDAADRSRGLRPRQLQRAAARIGHCQYAAGSVAVPVLVREPRRRDALSATRPTCRGSSARCPSTRVRRSSSRT